ncbi:formyltetrahydrofolate deformylase [Liberibacter crescens]|uniref:formyltetrahydrofolate deformylase n=1 Tax=Liberibacter crescens TaxID=1273132 RepID=UPI00076318DA|nr:formyltetrahydrofolate deformylase [Liberibacter crescens]AMC13390.1 formyltetrahydrofolate deformylase [Liberibacter crescens]
MLNYILTVTCPSKRGIIAAISGFLSKKSCNILDSSQFDDLDTKFFFMRVSFIVEGNTSLKQLCKGFEPIAEEFSMQFFIKDTTKPMKVIIMVSRLNHCLYDLLYRQKIGMLPMDITGVVSNHLNYQKVVSDHNIPFHYIPVMNENKQLAEKLLLEIIEETKTELVILARYMQILSESLCKKMLGSIINIHHSFLPSFKGANPYKQAYEYGVKLIGATAHYVTPALDEGPIIEQDTVRITHAQNAADYASIGRDIETQVLARAVHAHIHHRVFLNGNRTVVFPASPGSYAT